MAVRPIRPGRQDDYCGAVNPWYVIDGPAVPGGHRRRGLHAVGVALMILAAGTDLLEAGLVAAPGTRAATA